MAKLEYTPINDWQKFNFLGKRIFDFVNGKINISTGKYIGNGVSAREIKVDIIPIAIIIFSEADFEPPTIWIDKFTANYSKQTDGVNLSNGILSIGVRKDSFIIGSNQAVNDTGINYFYAVFGS